MLGSSCPHPGVGEWATSVFTGLHDYVAISGAVRRAAARHVPSRRALARRQHRRPLHGRAPPSGAQARAHRPRRRHRSQAPGARHPGAAGGTAPGPAGVELRGAPLAPARRAGPRLHGRALPRGDDGGAPAVGASRRSEVHAVPAPHHGADADPVGRGRQDHSGAAGGDVAELVPTPRSGLTGAGNLVHLENRKRGGGAKSRC